MTFTTCNRCGAAAPILAGGISRLEQNCLTDIYRCDGCGALTWRDRVGDRGNFPELMPTAIPPPRASVDQCMSAEGKNARRYRFPCGWRRLRGSYRALCKISLSEAERLLSRRRSLCRSSSRFALPRTGKIRRGCNVIWRRDDRVGVSFFRLAESGQRELV